MSNSQAAAIGVYGKRLRFYLLLALIVGFSAWAYWPGIEGPALLDDHASIGKLSVVSEKPELALDLILGDVSGPLGRPVSIASFIYEKSFLGDSTRISKIINVLLHGANGFLLAVLFSRLFYFAGYAKHSELALLLSAFWLLAPLHVSTVLYSVQRMAMLSTFFMLLSLNFYVFWRTLTVNRHGYFLLIASILLFLAGMFSKENAIVLIPIAIFMELSWFQCAGLNSWRGHNLRNILLIIVAVGIILVVVVLGLKWTGIAGGYDDRPFTLSERLFTELRILWDYIFQLLAPDTSRLGLYHDDVDVSLGLFQPFGTFIALLGWVLVSLLALILMLSSGPWGGRLSFGVLWYLIGHGLESTLLPLELYFEHRNYFPSMGVFLFFGTLFVIVNRSWRECYRPFICAAGLYVIYLAVLMIPLVQVWGSRHLLALHHVNGHPDSFRANTDMAILLASTGNFESARSYAKRAHVSSEQSRDGDRIIREIALSCISGRGVPNQLVDSLGLDNSPRPVSSVSSLLTLVRLIQDGKCDGLDSVYLANKFAELFLVSGFREKAAPNIYTTLATLENYLGRYGYAYRYMNQFLALQTNKTRGQLMQLHFTTALGKVEEANELVKILKSKRARGELTVAEEQTLSLYTEQ